MLLRTRTKITSSCPRQTTLRRVCGAPHKSLVRQFSGSFRPVGSKISKFCPLSSSSSGVYKQSISFGRLHPKSTPSLHGGHSLTFPRQSQRALSVFTSSNNMLQKLPNRTESLLLSSKTVPFIRQTTLQISSKVQTSLQTGGVRTVLTWKKKKIREEDRKKELAFINEILDSDRIDWKERIDEKEFRLPGDRDSCIPLIDFIYKTIRTEARAIVQSDVETPKYFFKLHKDQLQKYSMRVLKEMNDLEWQATCIQPWLSRVMRGILQNDCKVEKSPQPDKSAEIAAQKKLEIFEQRVQAMKKAYTLQEWDKENEFYEELKAQSMAAVKSNQKQIKGQAEQTEDDQVDDAVGTKKAGLFE